MTNKCVADIYIKNSKNWFFFILFYYQSKSPVLNVNILVLIWLFNLICVKSEYVCAEY